MVELVLNRIGPPCNYIHVKALPFSSNNQYESFRRSVNNTPSLCSNHVNFCANKITFAEALLSCFNLKKSAAKGHRLLYEAYGEHTPSIKTCEYRFRRFKSVKKLMLCIWWDRLGVVYHEILQPNETSTAEYYQQQLMQLSRALKFKCPHYAKRHDKVNFQHENARSYAAKVVKETLEALN